MLGWVTVDTMQISFFFIFIQLLTNILRRQDCRAGLVLGWVTVDKMQISFSFFFSTFVFRCAVFEDDAESGLGCVSSGGIR